MCHVVHEGGDAISYVAQSKLVMWNLITYDDDNAHRSLPYAGADAGVTEGRRLGVPPPPRRPCPRNGLSNEHLVFGPY